MKIDHHPRDDVLEIALPGFDPDRDARSITRWSQTIDGLGVGFSRGGLLCRIVLQPASSWLPRSVLADPNHHIRFTTTKALDFRARGTTPWLGPSTTVATRGISVLTAERTTDSHLARLVASTKRPHRIGRPGAAVMTSSHGEDLIYALSPSGSLGLRVRPQTGDLLLWEPGSPHGVSVLDWSSLSAELPNRLQVSFNEPQRLITILTPAGNGASWNAPAPGSEVAERLAPIAEIDPWTGASDRTWLDLHVDSSNLMVDDLETPSPDGRLAACLVPTWPLAPTIHDAASGRQLAVTGVAWYGRRYLTVAPQFSPDGRYLAAGFETDKHFDHGWVQVWDLNPLLERCDPTSPHPPAGFQLGLPAMVTAELDSGQEDDWIDLDCGWMIYPNGAPGADEPGATYLPPQALAFNADSSRLFVLDDQSIHIYRIPELERLSVSQLPDPRPTEERIY